MTSIWNMLQRLEGMLGTRDLTNWESDFVRNCIRTCGDKKDTTLLSDKQVEIVDSIHGKHFA